MVPTLISSTVFFSCNYELNFKVEVLSLLIKLNSELLVKSTKQNDMNVHNFTHIITLQPRVIYNIEINEFRH